jgi:hypothetical protein
LNATKTRLWHLSTDWFIYKANLRSLAKSSVNQQGNSSFCDLSIGPERR